MSAKGATVPYIETLTHAGHTVPVPQPQAVTLERIDAAMMAARPHVARVYATVERIQLLLDQPTGPVVVCEATPVGRQWIWRHLEPTPEGRPAWTSALDLTPLTRLDRLCRLAASNVSRLAKTAPVNPPVLITPAPPPPAPAPARAETNRPPPSQKSVVFAPPGNAPETNRGQSAGTEGEGALHRNGTLEGASGSAAAQTLQPYRTSQREEPGEPEPADDLHGEDPETQATEASPRQSRRFQFDLRNRPGFDYQRYLDSLERQRFATDIPGPPELRA